jgi:uncharacterized iron-regulated membrane protein
MPKHLLKLRHIQLRQWILMIHRYLGILAGIILIIISLTGSFLVFHEELDQTLNPQLLQVIPQGEIISPQRATEIARTAFPLLQVHRITVPRRSNQVYAVLMTSSSNNDDESLDAYIHPYTGHILGSRLEKHTFYGFLLNWHMSLTSAGLGTIVVGTCGIILVILGVTGVILWNGWKRITQGFRIRWNSHWQLLNYDLHRVGGVASVILLSLIALTGSVLIFWAPFEMVVYWFTGEHHNVAATSKVGEGIQPMPINALLQKVQASFPGTELYRFYPSKTPDAPFNVWLWVSQANPFNQSIYMHVDQYTGKVIEAHDPRSSWVDRILNAPSVLHVGHYGGLLTRVLYTLVGLAPLGLLLTGLIMFQQRRWTIARHKQLRRRSIIGSRKAINLPLPHHLSCGSATGGS